MSENEESFTIPPFFPTLTGLDKLAGSSGCWCSGCIRLTLCASRCRGRVGEGHRNDCRSQEGQDVEEGEGDVWNERDCLFAGDNA